MGRRPRAIPALPAASASILSSIDVAELSGRRVPGPLDPTCPPSRGFQQRARVPPHPPATGRCEPVLHSLCRHWRVALAPPASAKEVVRAGASDFLERCPRGQEQCLRDPWANPQKRYHCVIRVPEGEERECGTKKVFEERMAENFPYLVKGIKLQIQEAKKSQETHAKTLKTFRKHKRKIF